MVPMITAKEARKQTDEANSLSSLLKKILRLINLNSRQGRNYIDFYDPITEECIEILKDKYGYDVNDKKSFHQIEW